ncbi:putative glycosyl transferase [Bacteroidales bacterium Barb7]|nr:putative glycosyl transferase [Bacteroidales bacterium Barb7]
MSLIQIGVIIATSFRRTNLLFNRSLRSVLQQTYSPDYIVIVDDNHDLNEFDIIRKKLHLINNSNIHCIRNFRVKHQSGTGAWNSGADFLQDKFYNLRQSYIAILDDDDEWVANYLEKCIHSIETNGVESTKAVFANLVRLHEKFEIYFDLNIGNLTVENFLIGNPGVQGSNMFFNMLSFFETGGFDENLKSCTDRDLLIRFLQKNTLDKIVFINETLVYHYAQSSISITNISAIKWSGLDFFYNKYITLFTAEILEKSLQRAIHYFAYPNSQKILDLFEKHKTK